ncbi:acyl carrier protein [Primorskyibacter aestuariivivens]|uniref:acyl carrier protein n=1 Tax=Primorskyibacter aestuariivivens TaxID=1888912 RepID=UPI0023011A7D|nr:acyl carrier protein [Primorskyibacter aestuariivivens]MDA7429263.1 acyl carrier protein [Primorskyibacter aestuariivivens]
MYAETISENWIKERIAELVAFPVSEIHDASNLRDEIGLDSSDMMFVQLRIEQALGEALLYDESIQVHTFGDLMSAINDTLLLAA